MRICPGNWTRLFAAACMAAAAVVPGCMTLEQMAPPVDPFLLSVAESRGAASDSIERGRLIYLTDCVRCHAVEPIGRYDAARWQRILPEMAKESKLTPRQSADVAAYVLTARAALDLPRPAPAPPAR